MQNFRNLPPILKIVLIISVISLFYYIVSTGSAGFATSSSSSKKLDLQVVQRDASVQSANPVYTGEDRYYDCYNNAQSVGLSNLEKINWQLVFQPRSTAGAPDTRFAFVSVAANNDDIKGCIALMHSFRISRTIHDLVVIVPRNAIDDEYLSVLRELRVKIHAVDASVSEGKLKLEAFKLTQYQKILLVDSSSLILKNLDSIFQGGFPAPAAPIHPLLGYYSDPSSVISSSQRAYEINTGLLLLEPSSSAFSLLSQRYTEEKSDLSLRSHFEGKEWSQLPSNYLVISWIFEMRQAERQTILNHAKAIQIVGAAKPWHGKTSTCTPNAGFLLGLWITILQDAYRSTGKDLPEYAYMSPIVPVIRDVIAGLKFHGQYKFPRPRLVVEYHAEHLQDKWLNENIFHGKKDGVFIEAGTFHGVDGSNTFFFEKYQNWKGLCVEPDPNHHVTIQAYRNCKLVPKGLCNKNGKRDFIQFEHSNALGGFLDEMNDYQLENVEKLKKEQKWTVMQLDCITVSDMLKEAGISHVDLFSLDVEGAEMAVLKSFGGISPPIDYFIIEMSRYDEIVEEMKKLGYKPIGTVGYDTVFAKSK